MRHLDEFKLKTSQEPHSYSIRRTKRSACEATSKYHLGPHTLHQLCRVRLDSSRHSTGIDSAERLRSCFTVFAQDPTSSSKPKGRYPGGHTASVGSSSESLEPSARASHTWSSGPYKVSTGGADATLQFTSRHTNLHHCFHRCSCYPLCYLPSRPRTRTQSRCSPRRHSLSRLRSAQNITSSPSQ